MADLLIEFHPTRVPIPIVYAVKDAGKVVAYLNPETVETAYKKFLEMKAQNPYPPERQKSMGKPTEWDYDPRIKVLAEWMRQYCYAHEAIDDVMDGKEGWTFYAKDAVDALEMLDNALDKHGATDELAGD